MLACLFLDVGGVVDWGVVIVMVVVEEEEEEDGGS